MTCEPPTITTVTRSRKQNPEGLRAGASGGGGLYAVEGVPFLLA
jgi:hypothetical protein